MPLTLLSVIAYITSINAPFDGAARTRCVDHAAKLVETIVGAWALPPMPKSSGSAIIAVALSSSGHVETARLWRSSRSVGIDQEALRTAQRIVLPAGVEALPLCVIRFLL